MQIFSVGGSVRDTLLGRVPKDHDFVVVGTTPGEMAALGYTQVGKDFPVFLHPDTKEEYALARVERKTGLGYHGFACDTSASVTLEQDLGRRDLTINAIAMAANGTLHDPYHGQSDLQAKVLRHVSSAFAEDPVRILRLGRFLARYPEFSVAPETMALCRLMVENGEVDQLVTERVWQELSKGLMEAQPSRMFGFLQDCGALSRLLPELSALAGVAQPLAHHPEGDAFTHVMLAVDLAARLGHSLPVLFAVLMHDLGKGTTPQDLWPKHIDHESRGLPLVQAVCNRFLVSSDCRQVAMLVTEHHTRVHRALELTPGKLVNLLNNLDAFRRPERLTLILDACAADAQGRLGLHDQPYLQKDQMLRLLAAANEVDAGAVASATTDKSQIPDRIRQARCLAVAASRHPQSW